MVLLWIKFTSTYRLCVFMLILATTEVSETYYCKEWELGHQILDYFHPPYGENYDVGDCTDPCEMNPKFTDPAEIAAARNIIYECSKLEISCTKEEGNKYQTFDGSCNNLKNPSWGMANNCHRILLPHDYSNGTSAPRKSCLGGDLPSAREISNALHQETEILKGRQTLHFMEWGQTVAHDVSRTDVPFYQDDPELCCHPYPKTKDMCMAEAVPLDDPFYTGKKTCLAFERSLVCSCCNGSSREYLNKFTSYFDLSLLYGNDNNVAMELRSYIGGMLKTQDFPDVGELPPPTPGPNDVDGFCRSLNSSHKCFLAGDTRIAQNPLITVTHIILLRNHNNICRKLKSLNPCWDDEKLYMEARRINIAQSQFITFAHYLPNVLGRRLMSKFKLRVHRRDRRTVYDPLMDASVLNEATSAANRYGHSFVPDSVRTEDPQNGKNDTIYMRDYFFYPFDYYSGLLDRLAVGMTKERVRRHNLFYSSSVRDWLFHMRGQKTFGGSDLAAVSIIRGRDQGFPGYSYYLKYLFNHNVSSFCDLRRFIPPRIIRQMRKIYKSVHDVDLYTGGLAEYKVCLLGPTFTAMVLMQSQRMKFGDRYYFEHGDQAGSFTKEQLLEIKQTTFAKIICDTTKLTKIQANVFYPPSDTNPVKSCELLPEPDLSPWAENRPREY